MEFSRGESEDEFEAWGGQQQHRSSPSSAAVHCGFLLEAEMEAVGAGSEGWLNHPSLLLAMAPRLLAFARSTALLIATWEGLGGIDGGGGRRSETESKTVVATNLPLPESFQAQQQPPQQIKALLWIAFRGFSVLAVGTSHGSLLLYSSQGRLLLRQTFQASPILRLHTRGSSSKSSQRNSVEDLCVVYPKALVRIDASDLQTVLNRCFHEADDRAYRSKGSKSNVEGDSITQQRLPHQLWNVSKAGGTSSCVDAVIAGVMAPPLLEQQDQSTQRYYCAITVGPGCALAAYRLSEDKSRSLTSIFLKKVVPATVSTISYLTKALWGGSEHHQATDSRPAKVKPQEFARASLITSLKDNPRRGERIALSPSGSLAAVTDTLGRVLLVDTQALLVIRLWKGYRDARCYFLETPLSHVVSRGGVYKSYRKQDLLLCLVIHAPRRGVIEIWKLRNGPKVSSVKCGKDCCILQPSPNLRGSSGNDGEEEYVPAHVFVLDGDTGQLTMLVPHFSNLAE